MCVVSKRMKLSDRIVALETELDSLRALAAKEKAKFEKRKKLAKTDTIVQIIKKASGPVGVMVGKKVGNTVVIGISKCAIHQDYFDAEQGKNIALGRANKGHNLVAADKKFKIVDGETVWEVVGCIDDSMIDPITKVEVPLHITEGGFRIANIPTSIRQNVHRFVVRCIDFFKVQAANVYIKRMDERKNSVSFTSAIIHGGCGGGCSHYDGSRLVEIQP